MFSTRFTSVNLLIFSPQKSMHEMFALHANIAGYRILWQISYPARSTTQKYELKYLITERVAYNDAKS